MSSTGTSVEPLNIEDLDYDIPCEYSNHRIYGTGAAVWVVWFGPLPCGHNQGALLFLCEGCWALRCNRTRTVRCSTHEHTFPSMDNVLRMERIKP